MEMRPFFSKKIHPNFMANLTTKIHGLQCEIQWLNLFAPRAHKPILKEHRLLRTYTIAFGSWKAHKYVQGQGHFLML